LTSKSQIDLLSMCYIILSKIENYRAYMYLNISTGSRDIIIKHT